MAGSHNIVMLAFSTLYVDYRRFSGPFPTVPEIFSKKAAVDL
jgi:hypothetical protein